MILEEGVHPLLCCPKCDMFVTWRALNGMHQAVEICARGEDRRQERRQEEEAWRSTMVAF